MLCAIFESKFNFPAPALACPLPLASAQRGRKASGDETLKAYTAGQRHVRAITPSAVHASTCGTPRKGPK
jgi:hypothetical protein